MGNHEPPAGQRPPASRRALGAAAVVAVLVLTVDVLTKQLALGGLSDRPPIELLGGLLTLRLVHNSGAAFGIAAGYTAILSVLAIGVVGTVIFLARRLRSSTWAIAFGLLLGGALGNLSDRFFREPGFLRGHVVDFLELPYWPVFNLADTAVSCAAVLIVVLSIRGVHLDGTIDHRRSESKPGPEESA